MRLNSVLKNLAAAWIGQMALLVVKFITTMSFARFLNADFMGVNNVFSSIISVLSLAELGIGGAMNYSLYAPLAHKDTAKIQAIMHFYGSVYRVIGLIIGILGVLITPFLTLLSSDLPDIPYLHVIFLLYVLNTVLSYLWSYKSTLMIADQKRYIYLVNHYLFYVCMNIAQIIILYTTRNFLLYVLIQTVFTIAENWNISRLAVKRYPYLKEKPDSPLDKESRRTIIENTKSLAIGKIGGTIIGTTDNLVLTSIFGLASAGIYGNYCLIFNSVALIIGQVTDALTASIGNLAASEETEKQGSVFYVSCFINGWIYVFASICLYNLVQPFVYVWLGNQYFLDYRIIPILIINFFLSGMRKQINVFKDAFGLFYVDRWKSIIEAMLNLLLSILLSLRFGMVGVMLGTAISAILAGIWVEVWVLFKNGLHLSVWSYYLRYFAYIAIGIGLGILTGFICAQIDSCFWLWIILGRLAVCIVVPNVLWMMIWCRTGAFKYMVQVIRIMIAKILPSS